MLYLGLHLRRVSFQLHLDTELILDRVNVLRIFLIIDEDVIDNVEHDAKSLVGLITGSRNKNTATEQLVLEVLRNELQRNVVLHAVRHNQIRIAHRLQEVKNKISRLVTLNNAS